MIQENDTTLTTGNLLFALNDVHKQPARLPRSDKSFFDSCKQS